VTVGQKSGPWLPLELTDASTSAVDKGWVERLIGCLWLACATDHPQIPEERFTEQNAPAVELSPSARVGGPGLQPGSHGRDRSARAAHCCHSHSTH